MFCAESLRLRYEKQLSSVGKLVDPGKQIA